MAEPINVMVLGQVRQEATFRAAISRFRSFSSSGAIERIVFSTWAGEVDQYVGLREFLDAHGVELIETILPTRHMDIDIHGHFFHQAVQAIAGLDAFSPEDMVFKTRAEVRINLGLDFSAAGDFWRRRDLDRPPIGGFLRNRIGIGCYSPFVPFFFEDRYFFGSCADLRRMARLSRSPDILWNPNTAIAEARWYGTMFGEAFPVVRQMMRISWMSRVYLTDHSIFEDDIVYRSLAIYHFILEAFFTAEMEPHCTDLGAFAGSLEPPPASLSPMIGPEVDRCRAHPSYCETAEQLRMVGLDYLTRPTITAQFRQAVDDLSRRTRAVNPNFVLPVGPH